MKNKLKEDIKPKTVKSEEMNQDVIKLEEISLRMSDDSNPSSKDGESEPSQVNEPLKIRKDIEDILNGGCYVEYFEGVTQDELLDKAYKIKIATEPLRRLVEYITENYQPKTTSTDIEEKDFEDMVLRNYEQTGVEFINGVYQHVGYLKGHELWLELAPHLSNKSELKKEAVREGKK